MTTSIQSPWIFTIMCIYGQDDAFNDALYDFLGMNEADYYLDHSIFMDDDSSMHFNLNYGKKYNKVITSILRAFLQSYDSIKMNEYYLQREEEYKNEKDAYTLAIAHILAQLKKMHENLTDKLFLVKVTDERFATLQII